MVLTLREQGKGERPPALSRAGPFYHLPTLSVCLRLQQKQRKKTLNWQEISSDKRLPSSGGGRPSGQEAPGSRERP